MQIEDYFDFLSPNDIRLKGRRIGIENILYQYIYKTRTPEEIAESFEDLPLEDVYATILYYLHNRESVDAYVAEWIEHGRRMRAEQERNPTPVMMRLRKMKTEAGSEILS